MLIKTSLIDPFNCEITEKAIKKLDAIFKSGKIVVTKTNNDRYMVLYGILRHAVAVNNNVQEIDCIVVESKYEQSDTLLILDIQVQGVPG